MHLYFYMLFCSHLPRVSIILSSNCFYYVITIALSVITDRLICTDSVFMRFKPKSQQRPSVKVLITL